MASQSSAHVTQSAPRLTRQDTNMSNQPSVSRQVLRKAKRGNEEAISLLYKTYVNRIYRFIAYRLGGDTKSAEDLTSDVMVRMVRELPKYRITSVPFEVWLYRIASNRVVDYYRRNNKVIESQLPETLVANSPDPESALMQEQLLQKLRLCMIQLKPEEQIILSLRFFERKSHEEVSSILGKNISSIRTMQHRALKRLAELMNMDTEGSNDHA